MKSLTTARIPDRPWIVRCRIRFRMRRFVGGTKQIWHSEQRGKHLEGICVHSHEASDGIVRAVGMAAKSRADRSGHATCVNGVTCRTMKDGRHSVGIGARDLEYPHCLGQDRAALAVPNYDGFDASAKRIL